MSLEVYNEICYHGTTTSSANIIGETHKWTDSKKDTEWLGTGVYFFEKDIKQAFGFMKRARKTNQDDIEIIKARVKTHKMLDLDMTDSINLLLELKSEFLSFLRLESPGYPDIKIGKFMDFTYSIVPYDAIKKTYVVPGCKPIVKGTELVRTQIQVCVKDHSCIYDIERMKCNGC